MPKARTVVPGLKKRHLRAAIAAARKVEQMKQAPTEVKVVTPAGEKRTESSKEPPKATP